MVYRKINPTGYTGLAKANISSYNNAVKDYEREVRLGRGEGVHATGLVEDKIPYLRKRAINEMIRQDTRHGRITNLKKVFI